MDNQEHNKRVRFLRRLILVSVAAAILIPTMICVIFAARYDRAMNALERSREELTWYKNHYDARETWEAQAAAGTAAQPEKPSEQQAQIPADGELDGLANEAAMEPVTDEPADEEPAEDEWDGIRRVYLTFDDGPSSSTEELLDILARYGIKATFFVVGKPESRFEETYNRIVTDGHTLAMHSYSHRYSDIYESVDAFQTDLHKLQNFLYDTTGIWCRIYRFPGGSSNTTSATPMSELKAYLSRENITYFDWNVDAGDASGSIGAYQITDNVIRGIENCRTAVVLMHDAGNKQTTVEALPGIIEAVLAMDNTEFAQITEDTKPVHHPDR
ncbi:MAG: polysaccharide deacetylase [Lachnospiraceae bacterium]|nr:polysaccharide deacetylase [Lachnospiraceae bacterium]